MLGINADPYIKDKTALVVVDGIRATYNGEPIAPPMVWDIFAPEGTPNSLFFSTDPTTIDYCSRDLINEERAAHGWPLRICPWIESASADPYYLGISNPDEMTILRYDPALAAVGDHSVAPAKVIFIASCDPNPVTDTAVLRFQLEQPQSASMRILDASGRIIRHLAEGVFPAGSTVLKWDARDRGGTRVAAGVYFAHLRAAGAQDTRRILVARQ